MMRVVCLFLLLVYLFERSISTQTFIPKVLKKNKHQLNSYQPVIITDVFFRGGGYRGDDEDYRRRSNRNSYPQGRRKKSSPSVLTTIAKSSLSLSKKAALSTVKQSGKAAFYLMKPKSVEREEILGLWRLDQQVSRDDDIQTCSANIELTRSGNVLVGHNGGGGNHKSLSESYYHFSRKSWPQSCKVEFEARAFLIGDGRTVNSNRRPQLYFYRGYFERKVADPSVIKMTGKIYRMVRSGWRGKGKIQYVPVGTFLGRKRVMLPEEEFHDQYGDDEYDGEYDEEYDEEGYEEEYDEEYDEIEDKHELEETYGVNARKEYDSDNYDSDEYDQHEGPR